MKKLLALCLAAAGFAGLPLANADAHEAPAPVAVTTTGAVAALPSTARVNATVVIETHRRHYRRSRVVRRVYYRHGRRIVTTRRIYY